MRAALRNREICWAIGLGSPLAFYVLVRLLPNLLTASTTGVVVREIVLIVVPAGWLVWLSRRSPLSAAELGLVPLRAADLGLAVAAALLTIVISVAVAMELRHFGISVNTGAAIGSLAARPSWLILAIALTAAISEEAVFRAMIIAAIKSASGSAWIAVLVSAICFALPHVAVYGPEKILVALVPGLVMAGLFLWRGSLASCIVAHFLLDIVGLAGVLTNSHG